MSTIATFGPHRDQNLAHNWVANFLPTRPRFSSRRDRRLSAERCRKGSHRPAPAPFLSTRRIDLRRFCAVLLRYVRLLAATKRTQTALATRVSLTGFGVRDEASNRYIAAEILGRNTRGVVQRDGAR
jgi:hypothetical protein